MNFMNELFSGVEKHSAGDKSDRRNPNEIFVIPGTNDELEVAIWRSTHRKTKERSIYFDIRRIKDGKKLKTLRDSDLPAAILGLFTLARGLSRDEEWVTDVTRARCAYLADHLEEIVVGSATSELENGPAKANSLFAAA